MPLPVEWRAALAAPRPPAGVDLVEVVGPVAMEGAVTVKLFERLEKIGVSQISLRRARPDDRCSG